MDAFLILTPILLLAVVLLFGFVGCVLQTGGLNIPGQGQPIPKVVHIATVVKSAPEASDTGTATLPVLLTGGEFIVVTVQWGASAQLTLTGVLLPLSTVTGVLAWNDMQVQTFASFNDVSGQLSVKANLSEASSAPWNICVTAYSGVDENTPTFSLETTDLSYAGTNPQVPGITIGVGDLVYAVAFCADSSGAFPGSNSLVAGANFTAEFPAITNPLVEDSGIGNPVIAQATITSQDPNPKGFILAMGIKAASN